MQISVEDLAQEPDKYLDMLNRGDIYIARKGEQNVRLTQIKPSKKGIASKLFGILPQDADLDKAREERF